MDYSVPILTELVLVTGEIERTLKTAAKISPAQYQVLAALEGSQEPMTPSALARTLALPASSIATILGKLKKIGSVSASVSPDDGRIQLLTITGIGTMVLLASDRALGALFKRIWRPLSPEQRDITHWGSTGAMSGHKLIRVSGGSVNVGGAYCDSVLLSLRKSKNTLAQHGLSVNDYRVLKTVIDAERDGLSICASDLGFILVMSSPLVAQTTSSLENHGLAIRVADEKDARVRLVKTTEMGREIVLQARRELLRTMRKGMVPLSRNTVDEFGRIAEEVIAIYRTERKLL